MKNESIKIINKKTNFHSLLSEFPNIIKLPGIRKEPRHTTVHYIKTTKGPPKGYRPRRLAPDKLEVAKAEFDLLLEEGVIQPSKSPWAAPLYIEPKKGNCW